jgi:hypothetical protein
MIILSIIAFFGGFLGGDFAYVLSFGPPYNSSAVCTSAHFATIEAITANNSFTSIPNKRALNPPCASYVEIDRVVVQSVNPGLTDGGSNNDCSLNWSGLWCDSDMDVVSASFNGTCYPSNCGPHFIHVEIDQNWKANGIAQSAPPASCVHRCLINIRGFVYFDAGHAAQNNAAGNNGWEIHPLTYWTYS